MSEKEICPGCGRHCNLSEPHCERGEEYLHAGKFPEHRHSEHHHFGKRMQHYHDAGMNDKLIINLRDINHMMQKQYEGKASQKRILIILNESDTLTQKELTELLGIQPGSASEIISKLENAGLITRVPNETDRRTMNICLTETGTELALEAARQRQRRHEEMFACLSSEEQETLLSLLEKIHRDWESRFSGRHGQHDEHGGYRHHDRKHHGGFSHQGQ